MVGTRDAQLIPEGARVWGFVGVSPCRTQLTVYLPVGIGEPTVRNLRDNGLIALCATLPRTHRSVQIKGKLVELRDASPDEHKLMKNISTSS